LSATTETTSNRRARRSFPQTQTPQERAKASYIPSNQPHPWEKQPRESIPAWRAFETFLQLSVANPHREVSYGEVSAAVAKNKA